MNGVTLDAGALIALDRDSRRMLALLDLVAAADAAVSVPAPALAQAWRDGRRQARLARLSAARGTELVSLDAATARVVGTLCGATGTSDVVDVAVVVCARERGHAVVTSDPADLTRIDPSLRLHIV